MTDKVEHNHFVVKAKGKIPVHLVFAQTSPLTSCVAKIVIRKDKEVKQYVLMQGCSFWNPKDEWSGAVGVQKAFADLKTRWENYHPTYILYEKRGDLLYGTHFGEYSYQSSYYRFVPIEDVFPSTKDFERAYWEWYQQIREE